MKVCKFGGTSMANAASINEVKKIIESDKMRKFVVVSAPGKREPGDTKVTDLLYACYNDFIEKGNCDEAFEKIILRFDAIISGLGIDLDLSKDYAEIKAGIMGGAGKDYTASRGEYLSAVVTAKVLNFKFIDSAEIIKFDKSGNFESEITNELCKAALVFNAGYVIPGFYGAMPDGTIKTFSRGGSDVTGSIIARAVSAKIYENWTDVDGFMTCDPRIVKSPKLIEMLTYKELRELSYMGANVLHPDSIFPVRKNNIPINIKNTFNPSAAGTMIVPTKKFHSGEYKRAEINITGIAGKKDFIAIYVEKSMMNNELGFARKVLSILEQHEISMEHMPSGIDTMTVIFDHCDSNILNNVIKDIEAQCHPDNIEVVDDLSLIAVVGHGMRSTKGTATKVCNALFKSDINIRMIDQGSSELNIIVAVSNKDYEKAISALYGEFSC